MLNIKHPHTTIPGVLMLVAAICMFVVHAMNGQVGLADFNSLMTALGGVGLVGVGKTASNAAKG